MGKHRDLIFAIAMTIFIAVMLWYTSEINIVDINPAVIVIGILFVFAVLMTGTEIERLEKDNPNYKSVRFEDLEPGSYLFMTIPTQHINCSLTGECTLYFAFLEHSRNGKAIPVIIGISAKIDIQDAMKGKFINQIGSGEGLEIDKDHNITKIET